MLEERGMALTTKNEDKEPIIDTGTITNDGSKWQFWSKIIVLNISSFLGGLVFFHLLPFYTKEAKQRGVTVSQAGLVLGSVSFMQILFIPIFGKYLHKLRAYRLFIMGGFVCGVSNIVYGSLEWINDTQTFLLHKTLK